MLRRFALPLLLVVGFFAGFLPGTILAQQTLPHHVAIPAIPVSPDCVETGLTGAALQENKLFCNTAAVKVGATCVTNMADGGIVYAAAIGAANLHIIVGSPTMCAPSVNWSGLPITYVEFSSEFHAEFPGSNIVSIYNAANQRVYTTPLVKH